MKRYISAILVNALLLQLVGCYSQKAITYKEFYNLHNIDEAFILTTNNKSIKLTTDSLKNSYVKWNATEDSIIVWSTRTVHENKYSRAVSDTIKLSSSEIDKVYIDEFDETKAFIAIAIPVVFIVILGFVFASSFKLDWNTSKSGSGF
jgi:ABC-type long-subunit fatty acid transport system fused permease/ATPase subunit